MPAKLKNVTPEKSKNVTPPKSENVTPAKPQEGIPLQALDHSDDEFIPHMIYLLSFVLNVGGQYNPGGTAVTQLQRDNLRDALKLKPEVAKEIDNAFAPPALARTSLRIVNPFMTAIAYPRTNPGCPATHDALVTLAQKYSA